MKYRDPIFYNTKMMSKEEKVALLWECHTICYEWWVDKLDCSESFSRQRIDCTFDDILRHFDDESHLVVVDRGTWGDFDNREHFEVAFRSMENPVDFFLFIEVESDRMLPIIEKYRLELLRMPNL